MIAIGGSYGGIATDSTIVFVLHVVRMSGDVCCMHKTAPLLHLLVNPLSQGVLFHPFPLSREVTWGCINPPS